MLIHDDGSLQPGLHAIVIGVGYYEHLSGGKGAQFEGSDGMAQLSSPPHSAREIAKWLKARYNNPVAPLRTIDLLLSERKDSKFTHPGQPPRNVERARKAELKKALLAWKARGDKHADNTLLFYFCGHGIAAGPYVTLLAEDFGVDKDTAFDYAIDFHDMHLGWDKCQARRQIFFVDACRVASTALIESLKYRGDPIVPGTARMTTPARKAPVYFSAMPGNAAHGYEGESSLYTKALIASLEGLGGDDKEGDWRVTTETLNQGIAAKLAQLLKSADGVDQLCEASYVTEFTIHHLPGAPVVPVSVTCKPPAATASAVLSWKDEHGGTGDRKTPVADPWPVELPEGKYVFTASVPATGGLKDYSTSNFVRPPSRRVLIPVI